MAISIVMPALEMAQDTGKLLSWRKKEGEKVSTAANFLIDSESKLKAAVQAP